MSSSASIQVPVLIIGGGIVGLCSSLFLAQHGIHSIVVERHSGTSIHPRARGINARTMELLRHLGLEEQTHEAGRSIAASFGIHSGASVREIVEKKKRRPALKPEDANKKTFLDKVSASISPAKGTFVTQDLLEPVLAQAARDRGVDVRFYTDCLSVEQDQQSVTAVLENRETGKKDSVRAAYVIAADGAKSPIRSRLGIPTTGRGTLGHLINVLFTADLKELVAGREFSLCYIERPEMTGMFTSINNSDRWVCHLSYDPTKGEKPEDFPPERCKKLLESGIGVEGVDVKVISIMQWEPSVRVAERFREGRVFLAGDAAHQMPPWAGQGATTGISDGYNLAWKIAAVLGGKAGESLLDTYGVERVPVGRHAAEASAAGIDSHGFFNTSVSFTNLAAIIRKINVVAGFGYSYPEGALCAENTWPLGGLSWKPWTLPSLAFSIDGQVGRRVPHVWVERMGEQISTVDLCGTRFTLLAGAGGQDWIEPAKKVARKFDVDIDVYVIGPDSDIRAPSGTFEAASGITTRGALLSRPDDFVGWRSRRGVADPEEELEAALRKILCKN